MWIIYEVALNLVGDSIIGFSSALAENRHRDVLNSCGTPIGGGASDRSPGVDLSALHGRYRSKAYLRVRGERGEDEGQCIDPSKASQAHKPARRGQHLEMPTALRTSGRSVECQIDCESCQLY
jgi:hypothetical protein